MPHIVCEKKINIEVRALKKPKKKGKMEKMNKKTSIYSSCNQCDDAIMTHVARAFLPPKDSPNGPKMTELSHFFELRQQHHHDGVNLNILKFFFNYFPFSFFSGLFRCTNFNVNYFLTQSV